MPDKDIQWCDNDIAKALTICENMFTANKDIVGVFGANNMSGNGIARFIAQEHLGDKVVAVVFDADPEETKALRAGDLYAMMIQDPSGLGYYGVDMIYKIRVEGYDVEAEYPNQEGYPVRYVPTACTAITQDNIDDPELQGRINPYLIQDGSIVREWF